MKLKQKVLTIGLCLVLIVSAIVGTLTYQKYNTQNYVQEVVVRSVENTLSGSPGIMLSDDNVKILTKTIQTNVDDFLLSDKFKRELFSQEELETLSALVVQQAEQSLYQTRGMEGSVLTKEQEEAISQSIINQITDIFLKDNEKVQASIALLGQELETLKSRTEKELSDIRLDLEQLEKASGTSTDSDLLSSINVLKKGLEELKTSAASKSDMLVMKTGLDTLSEDIKKLKEASFSSDISKLKLAIDTTNSTVSGLVADMALVKQSQELFREEIESLETEIATKVTDMNTSLSGLSDTMNQNVTSLNNLIQSNMNNVLNDLSDVNTQLSSDIELQGTNFDNQLAVVVNQMNKNAQAVETNYYSKEAVDIMVNELSNNVNSSLTQMQQEVADCFQSASDGKKKIAAALTGKGITTSETETYEQMATKIKNMRSITNATITSIGTYYTFPADGCIILDWYKFVNQHDNSYAGDASMRVMINGNTVDSRSIQIVKWEGGSMRISNKFGVLKGQTLSLSFSCSRPNEVIGWGENYTCTYVY